MQLSCIVRGQEWLINISRLWIEDPKDLQIALSLYWGKADSVLWNCNSDTLYWITDKLGFQWIQWEKISNDDLKDIFPDDTTTVSVILQSENWETIYYMANMNLEAFNNSSRDSRLWVYSKTNKQLQLKWATSWDYINLNPEFKKWVDSNWSIILCVNVNPINPSVCHEKNPETWNWYPTCFFRAIEETVAKINKKLTR